MTDLFHASSTTQPSVQSRKSRHSQSALARQAGHDAAGHDAVIITSESFPRTLVAINKNNINEREVYNNNNNNK